jgi:serine/threonine protein kinase
MSENENKLNLNVIKDYIIQEKLGTGSYGVVYKVVNKCKIH